MDFDTPYSPPEYEPRQPYGEPAVWRWYVVYCVCMALLNLLGAIIAIGVLVTVPELIEEANEIAESDNPLRTWIEVIFWAITAVFLCVAYALAPLLPRTRGAWIYGIVAISLGMSSVVCLPVTLPLLLSWIKPETKSFFQATDKPLK